MLAAKVIAEKSKNNIKEFILVNKIGAHFPVHDKYPNDFLIYKPALKRGDFINISDTSKDDYEGEKDWSLYRNSYKNTLLWSVGAFFETLHKHADFSNVTLFYTSDHGQDLHLDNSPGLTTHCGGMNASVEEAIVPLLVIEGRNTETMNWGKNLKDNFNRSSHFNIFPSLLLLMNYDRDEVMNIYGMPLDEKVNDPYTFNARFNARLGKEPVWRKVELSNIVRPVE